MLMSHDFYDGALSPDEALDNRRDRANPSPEALLLRMAVERTLNRQQKRIWSYWNYDRLTQTEIAQTLGTTKQAVQQRVRAIERRLAKWCRDHMEVYDAIKGAEDGR